jgi:hypothetical protein
MTKKGILLTRESLLRKEKLKTVEVDLGEGQIVYVRQMTGREREQFESLLVKKIMKGGKVIDYRQAMDDFRAKLAVNCLCDAKGINLMRPEDYATLSQNMSAYKLTKIADAAGKLNGITEEDKEDLVKNSDGVQDDASNSDSVKS